MSETELITCILKNKGAEFKSQTDIAAAILARNWKGLNNWRGNGVIEVRKLGNIYNNEFTGGSFAGNVYDPNGLAPTINTMGGGGQTTYDSRNERNKLE